jgi:hypothetical protein
VLEPAQLVDSSADDLLEEIRRKENRLRLAPIAIGASVLGLLAFLLLLGAPSADWLRWPALAAGVLGLVCLPWATWHDRRAGLVRVHYVLDPLGQVVQEGLERLVAAFQRAHAVWAVHQEHRHGDWKRNAGAGTSVGRRRVGVGFGVPPFIETNARVGFLSIDGTRLYFFPDRLLVLGRGAIGAVRYADLRVEAGTIRFVEEDGVPRDARVIGNTWRYVNRDGGPDRRFRDNHQLPVVLYGTLDIAAPSGLRLSLQTSTDGLAAGTEELLRVVQDAVRQLESRRGTVPRLEPLPDFADDPPPLALPGLKALGGLVDLLSFRWLSSLPEWAVLAVWGILFALPPIALIIWFARGGAASNVFLCAAFTVAGAGAGRLLHEHLRRARARRAEEEAATRSRFRALLASELKSRRLEEVRFSELVAGGGIARRDADLVADEMFRRVADRFALDGVITEQERSKLQVLARALEIAPDRAARIEGSAKADRYRQAVSDALVDGTVTEEEAHMLNRLQAQLGIRESAWSPGDLVPRN